MKKIITVLTVSIIIFLISPILSVGLGTQPSPTVLAAKECTLTIPSLPTESGISIRVELEKRTTQETMLHITLYKQIIDGNDKIIKEVRKSVVGATATYLFSGGLFTPGTYYFEAIFEAECSSPPPFTLTAPSTTNCILHYTGFDDLPNITFNLTQKFEISNVDSTKAYEISVLNAEDIVTYKSPKQQGTGPLKFSVPRSAFPQFGGTYRVSAAPAVPFIGGLCDNQITVSVTEGQPPGSGDPGGEIIEVNPTQGVGGDAAEVAGTFASRFLTFGIGIGGGIAFLLMIFGAYRLTFAAGNPESIQQGQQIITAAIAGLLVIVFAVFILRFLGFTILGIGGLV